MIDQRLDLSQERNTRFREVELEDENSKGKWERSGWRGGATGRGEGTMDLTEKGKEWGEYRREIYCLAYAEAVAMHVYLLSQIIMHGRYDPNRVEKILRQTEHLLHCCCCT